MRKTSAFICKFFLSDFLYVAFQNSIKGAFRTTMKTSKIELLQKNRQQLYEVACFRR